ncbi:hypothetical protein AsAng_0035500 [Aureispira anguillae]|uniref:Uncharacterized protein n=1 Tax=Aureispira anguillae TaxID=2864201 RepID=A0A915YGW9_9BACT|nr:hypothetical protein AsAng_0035500 [Aureispira anguillae]
MKGKASKNSSPYFLMAIKLEKKQLRSKLFYNLNKKRDFLNLKTKVTNNS